MKKINYFFIILVFTSFLFSSCSKRSIGYQKDNSEQRIVQLTQEYDSLKLKEINVEGRSIFGIPVVHKKNNKENNSINIRFNGIQLKSHSPILPILTLLALSYETGYILNKMIGRKDEVFQNNNIVSISKGTGNYKFGQIGSSIVSLPISGALNNFLWDGIAVSSIPHNLKQGVFSNNSTIIDVYLNPNYDYHLGWWAQKIKFKAKIDYKKDSN
jgi:hypothetical protein